MITWKDIKLATLQKMFAADGNTIPKDSSTTDYIASMPWVANEGLQRLSTAGKFIIKSIDIAHNPIKNLVSDGEFIKSMERGNITYSADGARSIFFEYFGTGFYTVFVDNIFVVSGELVSETGYSVFRVLVPNDEDKNVTLVFRSEYPFAVKNVALYSANFPTVDKIPTFSEKVRYKLSEMVDDFYMLDDEPIVYEGDSDISRYMKSNDYFQEGNTVLVLDRDTPGNFRVYYKAYPQQITSDTTDNTILAIDPEVATLLPMYMAAELYKDDDNSIATTYRNEFEVAFSSLRDSVNTPSAERFTSESGWI